MSGPDIDDESLKGVIPRMVDQLFVHIMNAEETMEFTVKVAMMEIYNERIRDLLNRACVGVGMWL